MVTFPDGADGDRDAADTGDGDRDVGVRPSRERILTAQFARLAAAAALFFVAMGATFPTVPRFLRDDVGVGDTTVGVVLGALAIGAIIGRPVVGVVGDRRGRRILIVSGGLVAAVSMIGLVVVDNVPGLIALRILFGIGQGATFVGATTMAVDLAPPARSGEATSYVFVALHLGTGVGSVLGEWLLRTWSYDVVWVACAIGMTASAAMGLTTPRLDPGSVDLSAGRARFLHPQALVPGAILGMGIVGFTSFNAFVPLFGDEIGVADVAPYFLITSLTIVMIRGFGARLPDILGPRRGGTIALVLIAAGLTVIGSWRDAVGLGVGSLVLASGAALLLPSLVTAAVDGVPVTERSSALATYTLFLEISSALGAVLFGVVSAQSTYGRAFLLSAGLAVVALAMLRTLIPGPPSSSRSSRSDC